MRIELWILFITVGLIYNAYHDGIYTKMLKANMKYIKIAVIGFGGLLLYLFFKRHPGNSHSLLKHATELIKYMPIDRNSKDLVTPFLDLTKGNSFFSPDVAPSAAANNNNMTPQMKRMMRSGGGQPGQRVNRSVSETKKKFVASNQSWKCGHCYQQLNATFEIDHVIELQNGGTNEVSNLVALCRNCHGNKTMMTKLSN